MWLAQTSGITMNIAEAITVVSCVWSVKLWNISNEVARSMIYLLRSPIFISPRYVTEFF